MRFASHPLILKGVRCACRAGAPQGRGADAEEGRKAEPGQQPRLALVSSVCFYGQGTHVSRPICLLLSPRQEYSMTVLGQIA